LNDCRWPVLGSFRTAANVPSDLERGTSLMRFGTDGGAGLPCWSDPALIDDIAYLAGSPRPRLAVDFDFLDYSTRSLTKISRAIRCFPSVACVC
jgi:hypothetical protein